MEMENVAIIDSSEQNNEETQNTIVVGKNNNHFCQENATDVQPIIDGMEIDVVSREIESGRQTETEQIDMEQWVLDSNDIQHIIDDLQIRKKKNNWSWTE